MALLFSPVDRSELVDPFDPRPRTAFMVLQIGGNVPDADLLMANEARAALAAERFNAVTAADVRGTGDYLTKIVNLIRGCGFAVAVFSDRTPAKTLANIFFEIGVAGVLGKPVQLVLTGKNPAPSDFVRTEWISYKPGAEISLRNDLRRSLSSINELAAFYRTIGEVVLEAQYPDLELAFERFKQSVLIGDDDQGRAGISKVRDLVVEARRVEGRDDMASHRERLYRAASEFLRLLPPAKFA